VHGRASAGGSAFASSASSTRNLLRQVAAQQVADAGVSSTTTTRSGRGRGKAVISWSSKFVTGRFLGAKSATFGQPLTSCYTAWMRHPVGRGRHV
jgi:hypothetical protein